MTILLEFTTDWFGGLTITLEDNGETLLIGPQVDWAALYGLLKKARDLGMPLLSVSPAEPDQAEASDVNEIHQHRSKKEEKNEHNQKDHRNEREENHTFNIMDICNS